MTNPITAEDTIVSAADITTLEAGNSTDAGTLTGAEQVPVTRGGGLFQSTLTKVASWMIGTYQGFMQAGTGAVARSLQSKLQESVSVTDFGATGNGTTDDTAAIQAAVNTGLPVYMPPGTYYVTNAITLKNGQILRGAGRTATMFKITTTFNMTANGVLILGTGEPGAQVFDVGFTFTQVDQAVRANCTQYPYAIYAAGCARFVVDRVRIQAAWNGINATGNTGGCYIGFVEIGALNIGISFEGALDFVHGDQWHFWPFSISGTTYLYSGVYKDGTTIGVQLGRADGFTVNSISCFNCLFITTATADTSPTNLIGRLQLDSDYAGITMAGGVVSVGQLYKTNSSAETWTAIQVPAGELFIGQIFAGMSGSGLLASVTGSGRLRVTGGRINSNGAAATVFSVSAGYLGLENISWVTPGNTTYTAPFVLQSSTGNLVMIGNEFQGQATSTGTAVQVQNDVAGNCIMSNKFGQWTYTLPSNWALGTYGPNNLNAMKTFTPAFSFTTAGDLAVTYTTQSARYRETDNGIYFELILVFNTNAYTTATGSAVITGFPVIKGGLAGTPLSVGQLANITLSTGYTQIFAYINSGATYAVLGQGGSGKALAQLGTANFPASGSGFEISVSGFIATK